MPLRFLQKPLLLCCLIASQPAFGQNCTVSASSLSFDSYNTLILLPVDGAGEIQVACSGPLNLLLSYSISLSPGNSGNYAARTLRKNGNQLSYQIYRDAARLLIWGDGTGGTVTVNRTILLGLGTVINNHTVYARIPGGQNVPVGQYSDVIAVTVMF